MKLATYQMPGEERDLLGVVDASGTTIFPLEQFDLYFSDMAELIAKMTPEERALLREKTVSGSAISVPLEKTVRRAPIPFPRQDVICLGVNYLEHMKESARYKKEEFGGKRPYAVYFAKRVNEASAHEAEIPNYTGLVDSLDYEAELALIIGKDAKDIPQEQAFDYIFGYTIMNDVSARNLQTRHGQWFFGKSLDGFTPMGPWIVTEEEIKRPPVLKICSRVNGELRQNSCTDLFIFDIPHVIAELSKGMTLKAGTIISMGTPAGVGMGYTPPRFMQLGDVVECEVEGIGTLRNRVAK